MSCCDLYLKVIQGLRSCLDKRQEKKGGEKINRLLWDYGGLEGKTLNLFDCTHCLHGLFKEAEYGSSVKLEIKEQESIFFFFHWLKQGPEKVRYK